MQSTDTFSAQETADAGGALARDRALHAHVKTRGEKKFDWLTYTGIGYFANVAISLGAVYWAERTHSGQKTLKGIGHVFEKLGAGKERGEFLGRKSFFLTGGFLVVPFMKWLEDGKVEHVKRYNREIYGDAANTDPTVVQSEKELETAPKQGWTSIVIGRLLALVPFYLTVGVLWDHGSKLSRLTNPELGAMDKVARKAMSKDQPEAFAKLASKGLYFDRPITGFARDVGKLAASSGKYFDAPQAGVSGAKKFYQGMLSLAGKLIGWVPENKAAVQQIEAMEKHFPGSMQSVKNGHSDPIHSALPYYAVSEAITSAMVAWGLYVITRVTGPFFGKKEGEQPAPAATPTIIQHETIAHPVDEAKKRFTDRLEEQHEHAAAVAR